MSLFSLPWQLLAILAAALTSLSLALNKQQTTQASALQVRTYYYFFASIFIGGYWALTAKSFPEHWALYFLFGMAAAVMVVLFTMAQRISMSNTSLTEPVGQLVGIVLAAVIFSEWRLFFNNQGFQLLAALALVPLQFWLLYEKTESVKRWFKLSFVYLAALGAFTLVAKKFVNSAVNPAEVLAWQYFGSLTITAFGVLVKRQKFYLGKKFAFQAMIQAVVGGFGILLFYASLKFASITQVTLIRSPLLLLLTTIIGLYGFKEAKQMTLKKWLGVAVALVIIFLVLTSE